MPSANPSRPHLLDLDDLEADATPLFIIKIGEVTTEFEILFSNHSFRTLGLRTAVLAQGKAALLFRSWAQAVADFKPEHDFSGRTWSAEYAGRSSDWKIVRAVSSDNPENDQQMLHGHATPAQSLVFTRSRTRLVKKHEYDQPASFNSLPSTDLNTRWESIQTMMEMSDVGVFEYNPQGKLVHANEAWYRLRYVHQQRRHK